MLISLQKPVLPPDGTATEKRILPQGHAVLKERLPAPDPEQGLTIPFGHPPPTETPRISEPDNRN